MEKTLKDISWDVTEEVYRKDKALSYSTLAKYEREGFNNLSHLFDKVSSPSLLFGSCVDTLITGSQKEFDSLYLVVDDFLIPSDTLAMITKVIWDRYHDRYESLTEIGDVSLLLPIEGIPWNNHWLPKTRATKIRSECNGYYKLLFTCEGKTIITKSLYKEVLDTVEALKTSEATKNYFAPNNPFDSIQRYYQLKFKATFNNINYRCMADLIIVIPNQKLVVPVDLKTSSHTEWDFYKSFIEWRYDVQSRLYWRIIRANMNRDPYFKDFELANYKFIVANRKTLKPLVWDFPLTKEKGTITLGKNNQIILRDPFEIGQELNNYLNNNYEVPIGINETKPNDLIQWINKI